MEHQQHQQFVKSQSEQVQLSLLELDKQVQTPSSVSQYLHEYQEIMLFFDRLVQQQMPNFQNKMAKQNIVFSIKKKVNPSNTIKIKNYTVNKEVVTIRMQWGYFEVEAKILNIREPNKQHAASTSSGCYGNIYQGTFLNEKIAIKCLPVKSQSTRFNAIKEWFLLKIASAAQFGPKLLSCFGFDILMFQTCCQFVMEICQKPVNNVNFQHMFWNLAMMHKLHLIHLDIKPQNIMLSPFSKKPVFIDFGLSKMIRQDIGQKSLTEFIGTITFCTEEMVKCYLNKKKGYVDLYMNDLYALRQTLKIFYQYQRKEDNEEQQQVLILYNQNVFSYPLLFLMKFYLYQNHTEKIFSLLAQFPLKQKQFYRKEALLFFLQLSPTNNLKKAFLRLQNECQIQSQLYSRIKLLFELRYQKCRPFDFFRDDDKYKPFQQICQQFENQELDSQLLEQNHEREIYQLLTNPENIKKIPFSDFVDNYLEFMNFINNKNEATSQSRHKAAEIYYSQFISKVVPKQLTHKRLIKLTIEHILNWGLSSEKLSENVDNFALFTFRIYDFLVILHSQTSTTFLKLVQSLFNHYCLLSIYQRLFLLRIKHSVLIIIKHLFLGSQQARISFAQAVFNWVETKQKQLATNWSQTQFQKQININLIEKQRDILKLSQQFMEQFGTQIIYYQKILPPSKKSCQNPEMLMELFNKLNYQLKSKRIFYFSLDLYQWLNFNHQGPAISKSIFHIIKKNINDQELFSQFIFTFEHDVILKILNSTKDIINEKTLQNISHNFDLIHKDDLIFLRHFIIRLFHKIIFHQKVTKFLSQQRVLGQNVLIQNISNCFFDFYIPQLFGNSNYHKQISPFDLYQLLHFRTRQRYQKQDKIIKIFKQQSTIDQIKCQKCHIMIHLTCQLLKLLTIFGQLNPTIISIETNLAQQKYFAFSEKVQLLILKLDENRQMIKCMGVVLRMGQIICCNHSSIEETYQRLQKYYQFAIQYDYIQSYFNQSQENSFPLFYTLLLLYQKHYEKYIDFLIKMVEEIDKRMINRNLNIIISYCSKHVQKLSQDKLYQLFIDLKTRHASSNKKTNCISIIYSIILKHSNSEKRQKIILADILKLFHKLHSQIQREISVSLVLKMFQNINNRIKFNKRLWLYCNNKAAKLLMIEGKSSPVKGKWHHKLQNNKLYLRKKISNIHVYSQNNVKIKFRKK